MSILLIIPVLLGILTSYMINYLSDVLPDSLHLGIPVCNNQACREPYAWRDYLLFSRCRGCGQPRNLRTFLVPALTLAASLCLWFEHPARLGFAFGLLMLTYLILIAVIDLEHRLVLRPLSMIGLALATLAGFMLHDWQSTLIGGVFGFTIMFIFYFLGTRVTRWIAKNKRQDPNETEETLGSGDVTLSTILGLFLGWPLIPLGLLLGALILGISLILFLGKSILERRYRNQGLVYIPLGLPFILSTMLLIYIPNSGIIFCRICF
jgi:leader peptidase (prepilin peptidase)/N-methyltransferase